MASSTSGLLTSVGSHVYFESTLSTKFSIKAITLERRRLLNVDLQVLFEMPLFSKYPLTVIALERYMRANMPLEGSQCRAYSAADNTLKRVCVVTSLNMFLDLSNSFTDFTAENTSVCGTVSLLLLFLLNVLFQLRNN